LKTGIVAGNLPSAVLTVLLILIGVSTMTLGIIADILYPENPEEG